MQFLSVGGDTFHIKSHLIADSPTVIFIHALGADLRIFDAVVRELADENVGSLRYDLRGHGLSDLGRAPRHIDDHAADLAALIDATGVKKATICGVSVGGMIALALWRRRPELVERLALCCTGAKIGTTEAWNQRIAAVRQGGPAAVAEAVLQRWFSPEEYQRGGGKVALCRNMLSHGSAAGYVATCVALRDSDLTEVAAAVDVPCLCIAGEFDGSTPPELVRGLHESLAKSRFAILPGAGHVPPLQQPEALTREILDFVR
jgi:3-oxoadipate enol-lactonase